MSSGHEQPGTEACLARSVVDTLAEEPSLEAVTFDAAQKKISVATLGRTDVEKLTQRLTDKFLSSQNADPQHACSLLSGKSDCAVCELPLSATERQKITIQHDGGSTTIARVTCPTAPKFWRWRDLPFPKVAPREMEISDDDHHINEWKWQLVLALVCGALGLLAAFAFPAWRVPLFVSSYLAGAFFAAEEVWERLQKRILDVHFLMLAVAVGAACIGAWPEGATLLFLFSFSGALEHYAFGRTQKEIRSLFRDAPKTATAIDANGNETEVTVERILKGARLLIKPGSQFPVDCEIVRGATASDESNLTGEAAPVEKVIGDTALAGTINLWGAVEVVVLRPAAESSLQKIIKLIKEAQHQKAPAQQFADKFSTYYTYSVLGLSLAMFFVWRYVRTPPPDPWAALPSGSSRKRARACKSWSNRNSSTQAPLSPRKPTKPRKSLPARLPNRAARIWIMPACRWKLSPLKHPQRPALRLNSPPRPQPHPSARC